MDRVNKVDMDWNVALYQKKHGFVAQYGKNLLAWVPKDHAQHVLDFGCGSGELTVALLEKAGQVVGVDQSENMIAAARASHPGPEYHVLNVHGLAAQGWSARFDLVFSNAVFHWIRDQAALLRALRAVLKPRGLLLCEFGASGNVAAVCGAFAAALEARGHAYADPFYFPAPAAYRQILETAGFQVLRLEDYDRPTPLCDGEAGLRLWLEQFFAAALAVFERDEQEEIFQAVEAALRPRLWNGRQWTADYRRLRVQAVKT